MLRSLIILSMSVTAIVGALSDMKAELATNLEYLSLLQLNLPYFTTHSRSISRQLREIFLDTRRSFLVQILVVGVGMLFFSDCKEYELLNKCYISVPPNLEIKYAKICALSSGSDLGGMD